MLHFLLLSDDNPEGTIAVVGEERDSRDGHYNYQAVSGACNRCYSFNLDEATVAFSAQALK